MKKILITISLLIVGINTSFAQHDEDNYNQWASMEFKQWDFSPKSYYYSWVKKKVLWWYIDVPGTGIHDRGVAGTHIPKGDNYVNQDWRQMSRLRAISVASTSKQTNNDANVNEQWKTLNQIDVLTYADKNIDAAYAITQGEREKLTNSIMTSMILLFSMDEEKTANFVKEFNRIISNIKTINKAHMENAKKVIAYSQENKSLKELDNSLNMVNLLIKTNKIMKGEK